jgi:hypothetical protein
VRIDSRVGDPDTQNLTWIHSKLNSNDFKALWEILPLIKTSRGTACLIMHLIPSTQLRYSIGSWDIAEPERILFVAFICNFAFIL